MSKNQQLVNPDQGAAMAALLSSGGSNNPVADRVLALLEDDLRERAEQKAEEKRQQEAFRESRRKAMLIERAQQEALQSACPHMKPNYQPNIGGQRDHQGSYHWICSYCQKEWTDTELPAHLRIPTERVGGPL